MNKHNFAYSVGLIRALETLLLKNNEVERMMFAKDGKDSFKVFNELDYATNRASIQDIKDFQKVIEEGLIDTKKTLDKITPDKEILKILWYKYDFHNIKTLIKAKFSAKTPEEIEEILSPLGAVPIKALIEFIFEEKNNVQFGLKESTEEYIKKNIRKTCKYFQKERNPQLIDLSLDRALVKTISLIIKTSQNSFLQNYIEKFIDLTNIKLFFRMKAVEKDAELFRIAFITGGTIPFSLFRDAYKNSLDNFGEIMKNNRYGKIVEIGLKYYKEEQTFIFLEKETENYLTEYIKAAKLIPFGPEPLIAYFLAKENNALIIRMIMINKINKTDPEEIRDRLRTLYN
jgi:V/A-type H+/Na+-transporting ATPase subunit C